MSWIDSISIGIMPKREYIEEVTEEKPQSDIRKILQDINKLLGRDSQQNNKQQQRSTNSRVISNAKGKKK